VSAQLFHARIVTVCILQICVSIMCYQVLATPKQANATFRTPFIGACILQNLSKLLSTAFFGPHHVLLVSCDCGAVLKFICMLQQVGAGASYPAQPPPPGTEYALTDDQRRSLQYSAFSLRRWGWTSFWVQLALSLTSTGILLFSVAFTANVRCYTCPLICIRPSCGAVRMF
jgi:hypothetical protein